MFDFKRATVFCLGYRLSKHKITICSKHFGGHDPLGPPGYAYGLDMLTFEGAWHLALATPMLHMSLKTNGYLLSLAFLQLDYATHDQIAHGY